MTQTLAPTRLFGVGPVLPVPDVPAAAAYYCDVLGFTPDFVDAARPATHGSVTRDRVGVQFTLAPAGYDPATYPGWTYLFVDRIDSLAAEYQSRGVPFTRSLQNHDHGMREFEIRDAAGYRLRFGQYLEPAAG